MKGHQNLNPKLSATMRKVFTEISSLLCRSNGHWREQSFAASVPFDVSKVQKGRKRVSKDERKAMVVSFLNKYRTTNEGNFPTASEAIKQVGGSYYVIKKILQELEYESRISSMNPRNNMKLRKIVIEVNEKSKQVEEFTDTRLKNARINEDVKTLAGYDVDIGDFGLKSMSEEIAKHKTTDECSTYSEPHKHISEGNAVGDIHQCPEESVHGVKKRPHYDGLLDIGGPKTRSEQHQQSSESDQFARALSGRQNNKLSVWANLKTLGDVIIKMWKYR